MSSDFLQVHRPPLPPVGLALGLGSGHHRHRRAEPGSAGRVPDPDHPASASVSISLGSPCFPGFATLAACRVASRVRDSSILGPRCLGLPLDLSRSVPCNACARGSRSRLVVFCSTDHISLQLNTEKKRILRLAQNRRHGTSHLTSRHYAHITEHKIPNTNHATPPFVGKDALPY